MNADKADFIRVDRKVKDSRHYRETAPAQPGNRVLLDGSDAKWLGGQRALQSAERQVAMAPTEIGEPHPVHCLVECRQDRPSRCEVTDCRSSARIRGLRSSWSLKLSIRPNFELVRLAPQSCSTESHHGKARDQLQSIHCRPRGRRRCSFCACHTPRLRR